MITVNFYCFAYTKHHTFLQSHVHVFIDMIVSFFLMFCPLKSDSQQGDKTGGTFPMTSEACQ